MDDISHYGVKGMKWGGGVRRYQKYPGGRTQRSIKKYKESEKKYEEARKQAKASRKSENTQDEIKWKTKEQSAKDQKGIDYKKIKKAYNYDKGKELYSSGKRMRANSLMTRAYYQSLISGGSIAVGKALYTSGALSLDRARQVSGVMVIGGTAVNITDYVKTVSRNKKLSAYYAD